MLEEELLNVLDAANGYLGFFGFKYGVSWGDGVTVEKSGKKQVVLDYSILKDKNPPFAGSDIDTLMGSAIHECGHLKWSYPPRVLDDYIADKLGKSHSPKEPPTFDAGVQRDTYTELCTIAHVVEDFYAENRITKKYPALGDYLREARLYYSRGISRQVVHDLVLDPPPWSSVLAMWGAHILSGEPIPKGASDGARKYLDEIMKLSNRLTRPASHKTRLDVMYQIWQALRDLRTGFVEEDLWGIIFHIRKEMLPRDVQVRIFELQKRRNEDIIEAVRKLKGGGAGEKLIIETAKPNAALKQKLYEETLETASKVRQLFEADKRLRIRHRRALWEGAIDRRRLYKVGAGDYRVFEKKDLIKPPSIAVVILVDASGSMGFPAIIDHDGQFKHTRRIKVARQRSKTEGQIFDALRTAMALRTALSKIENIDLMVTAYGGTSLGTSLYRIYDRKTGDFLAGVKTDGGTPSGIAIAALALEMDNYVKGKEKLIIHVTDGAPSSYDDVTKAVEHCQNNKIDVMTLTLCRFDSEVIKAYKGLVEFINDISDLPRAVALLLFKKRIGIYR